MLLTPRPPLAGSAIAVLRLSGPEVPNFLSTHFDKPALPARCVHGHLHDGSEIIDDAILTTRPDRRWADLCLHGGAWIIERAISLAQQSGFELLPSSLPLDEKMFQDSQSIVEQEMLQYLPMALTEETLAMLLAQPTAWSAAGESLSAFDAARIAADRTLWRLLHPPTIAIVGAPNVGKSTLANRLFGQQRSITADIPGTTRDWVGEMANLAGLPAMLIDTPGLRQTADDIERHAIAASSEKIREADLVIELLDATAPPATAPPPTQPTPAPRRIIVVNKIDQPPKWNFQPLAPQVISAQTGQGCDELLSEIHRHLGVSNLNDPTPMRWWTPRQLTILRQRN
jgi:small GTP-binding protein